MTEQEFAQKIRTKYPGSYDNIPDSDLVSKVLAKYPVYESQIVRTQQDKRPQDAQTFEEPIEQEAEAGKPGMLGVGVGALKGAGETMQNIGNLIVKPVGKMLGVPEEQIGLPKETFEPKGTAEKVGYYGEKFGEFAVPATKVAQATKAMSFIPKVLSRVGTDVAVSAAQTGGDKEAMGVTGVVSSALNSAPLVFKAINSMMKGGAAALSGAGSDIIEQVIKTPEAAKAGMRGDRANILQQGAKEIRSAVSTIRQNAQSAYKTALEKLPDVGVVMKEGQESVLTKFSKTLAQHNIILKEGGKKLATNNSTLPGTQVSQLKSLINDVNNWTDTTPAGINRLAQKVGSYYNKAGDKQFNKIVTNLENTVKGILDEYPEIKKMNQQFAKEMKFIEQLDTHFSTMGQANSVKGLAATAGKLKTLFTKDKEMSRRVLELIPGGKELIGELAGSELTSTVPRSTARLGDRLTSLTAAIIPPKAVGEVAAFLSTSAEKAKPIVDALNQVAPAARAGILAALQDLLGQSSTQGQTELQREWQ